MWLFIREPVLLLGDLLLLVYMHLQWWSVPIIDVNLSASRVENHRSRKNWNWGHWMREMANLGLCCFDFRFWILNTDWLQFKHLVRFRFGRKNSSLLNRVCREQRSEEKGSTIPEEMYLQAWMSFNISGSLRCYHCKPLFFSYWLCDDRLWDGLFLLRSQEVVLSTKLLEIWQTSLPEGRPFY
jgi:hypothetical protein